MDRFVEAGIIRKGMAGRVKAANLFAFNETLKKDSLKEKSYWELSKDSHPVNRSSYNRWLKEKEEGSLFEQRFQRLPVDQKYRAQQYISPLNLRVLIPFLFIGYFVWCYVRYSWNGTTPQEGAVTIIRSLQNLPKPLPQRVA